MLSLIVAMDRNRLIGSHGDLPWHYPEDLRYFKQVTMGHRVVMGRRTYESILKRLGKPLPGRISILITRYPERYADVECYPSIEAFLERYGNCEEEIFVIGGAMLYEALLPYCQRLYITKIHRVFEGDTYFPSYDETAFELIHEKKQGDLSFCIYERRDKR